MDIHSRLCHCRSCEERRHGHQLSQIHGLVFLGINNNPQAQPRGDHSNSYREEIKGFTLSHLFFDVGVKRKTELHFSSKPRGPKNSMRMFLM